MTLLLLILLVVALLGGVYGGPRGWGYYGWSPFAILLIVLLVLLLTGYIRIR
jgi:hypothetical protein